MVNIAILLNLLIFYGLPGGLALYFLVRMLTNRRPDRTRQAATGFGAMVALLLCIFIFLSYSSYRGNKNWERSEIGTYYLTNYPRCQPCVLELRKNNVFVVRQNREIKETGRWHFESGQDYWITYLDGHGQLGSGEYTYQKYHLKHPRH